MSEETQIPAPIPTPLPPIRSAGEPTAGIDRELAELRKEVIEARNLVIKTDNLLKNLHAELKNTARKQEQFERRSFLTSVTAYILFAVMASAAAFMVARSDANAVRTEAAAHEGRARTLYQEVEKLRIVDSARRDASEKALRIFEQLQKEKEGPALSTALATAARIDRSLLSALEAKALEDKEASLKHTVAQAVHDRGRTAFRRGDYRTAAQEMSRYVELMPTGPEVPYAHYWLGESRSQLRDYGGAVAPLETFLKTSTTNKNHDWASVLLGQAYQETGQHAKAAETFQKALTAFPSSIHANHLRNLIKRLPSLQAAAEAKKSAAAVPPKP